MPIDPERRLRLCAAPVGYVALCGVWFALSAGYLLLFFRSGSEDLLLGAGAAAVPALGFWFWLRGFSITVDRESLVYRDGLYRQSRLELDEILAVETAWVRWPLLGDRIGLPRLLIRSKTGPSIIINTKLSTVTDAVGCYGRVTTSHGSEHRI